MRIAFVQRDRPAGRSSLWVMNADGSQPLQLTHGAYDDQDPEWSPDGLKLAYASNRDGHWEIYTRNAIPDGLPGPLMPDDMRITHSPAGTYSSSPSWKALPLLKPAKPTDPAKGEKRGRPEAGPDAAGQGEEVGREDMAARALLEMNKRQRNEAPPSSNPVPR